jgi:hypothetical protein
MEHNNEINEIDVMILAVEKKNASNSQTILAVFGMIAGSIPLTIIAPMPILSVLGMGVGTLSGGIAGIVVNEQMHPDNKKKIVNTWDGMTDIVMKYWKISKEITLKYFGKEIEVASKTMKYVGQKIEIASEPLIKTYNKVVESIEIKSLEYLEYLEKINKEIHKENAKKRKEEYGKYMSPMEAEKFKYEQWQRENRIVWYNRDAPSAHQSYWKISA